MDTVPTSFYHIRGTLAADAPSYVERQADRDLHDGLTHGDFCYVLTSRQMGKSSLMARTAARLRAEGVAVVTLDLTAIGQNLSPEQWYDGLLSHLGQALNPSAGSGQALEDALDDFWLDHPRLGPLQRWMAALRQVVLARVSGRIVIFIDEVDAVRSLPFSTDEFFAGIRECYNRRTQDPEFARLTFCLLGVASPSDLIRDARTTPFNIGRRIELTDFTEAEALPLAAGLVGREVFTTEARRHGEEHGEKTEEGARALLRRVLYWTGGHPYLTQRLFQAIAEATGAEKQSASSPCSSPCLRVSVVKSSAPNLADRLCEELFLSPRARERDDNLLFVRERLLRPGVDLAGLLELYGQVRRGRRVPDDETSPLVDVLRLSGVTRAVDGALRVRNRVYARVFDPAWIAAQMPDAERRRQRAAYRRGLWRAAAVSGVVLAAMVGLSLMVLSQARRAERQRRLAQEGQRALHAHVYAAQLIQAQQAEEAGNVGRARELLEAWRPEPGQEDLRSFEWRYLWRLCQGAARDTLSGHTEWVSAVAYSPDGKLLATGSGDQTIRLWNAAGRQEIARLQGHTGEIWHIAFSPNGKMLASGGWDKTVRVWDVASRREVATLRGHTDGVHVVAFSPDGKLLASGSQDRSVRLWDLASRRAVGMLTGYTGKWHSLAFAPDGKTLALGSETGPVQLWDVASRRQVALLKGHTADIACVAFSPDGRSLASGSHDSTIRLWDLATRREVATLSGHREVVNAVGFSPDGGLLASGSRDSTVKLWDLRTRRELPRFKGHARPVNTVVFSPDGKTLASGSWDFTVKLWDPATQGRSTTLLRQATSVQALAFSPDGRALATAGGDGAVRLWNLSSRSVEATLKGHTAPVRSLAFSSDGRSLVSGSDDHTVKLWDLASRRVVVALSGFQGGYWAVALSSDGTTLAMQGRDAVRLWDRATRRWVASFPWATEGGWCLAFSPDGQTLAAVRRAVKVTLWARGRGWQYPSTAASDPGASTLRGLANHPMAFSPDGKTLVTGGWLSSVKLWDVATKRLLASLSGRNTVSGEFAFSPDGKTLAASSGNGVTLFNVASRQETLMLRGHTGTVYTTAFSPDGNTLASGSFDGTVRLWHAATRREYDPLRVLVRGAADRSVSLQWRALPGVTGYHLYRGPAGAASHELVRLTPRPIVETSFTDHGSVLVNGRPLTYGIAPVYRSAAGKIEEGNRVTLPAIPVSTPPGFTGYSIDEGSRSGWVLFDPPSGMLTLHGSGTDIWDVADQFYFLCRPVTGDFQITVQALTRPTRTDVWASAGPMARETLEGGARHAVLILPAAMGLQFKWRSVPDDGTDYGYEEVVPNTQIRVPMRLRLTRRGNRILPAYAMNGARQFRPAGEPYDFDPPLPRTLYVGLAITAHNPQMTTEAKFRDLEIRQP